MNVFPRFKERDPYRVLGVDRDVSPLGERAFSKERGFAPQCIGMTPCGRPPCPQATYEEIQEARNFLVNEHKVPDGAFCPLTHTCASPDL